VYSSEVEHWTFNPRVLGSNPSIPIFIFMITLNITYILNLTSIVFFIGLIGIVLNRKNILIIIMSIELLLLAINLNFAAFSIYLDDIIGQIFVLFILTIAAAESAIGLAIITVFYKLKNSIELEPIKKKNNNKV
jgi:NADH-quinone oxidoreductase subunit K